MIQCGDQDVPQARARRSRGRRAGPAGAAARSTRSSGPLCAIGRTFAPHFPAGSSRHAPRSATWSSDRRQILDAGPRELPRRWTTILSMQSTSPIRRYVLLRHREHDAAASRWSMERIAPASRARDRRSDRRTAREAGRRARLAPRPQVPSGASGRSLSSSGLSSSSIGRPGAPGGQGLSRAARWRRGAGPASAAPRPAASAPRRRRDGRRDGAGAEANATCGGGAGIANSSAASTSCGSSDAFGSGGSSHRPVVPGGFRRGHRELLGGEHVVRLVGRVRLRRDRARRTARARSLRASSQIAPPPTARPRPLKFAALPLRSASVPILSPWPERIALRFERRADRKRHMSRLLLVPLDDIVVFPAMNLTLPSTSATSSASCSCPATGTSSRTSAPSPK